jgi:hypothetical protein
MLDATRKPWDAGRWKTSVWLLPVLLLAVTAGCGTACRSCHSGTASLASAPERVQVDAREYTLTANAWRDFQPVAPPQGQPLIVVVKVLPVDKMTVPDDLAIDHLWVLNGKEQWSMKPEPAAQEPAATSIEAAVRGGPKWGPGIKVDVVARLKQGRKTFLVRAAGVDIRRTD